MSPSKPDENNAQYMGYGNGSVEEQDLDQDEERLYVRARALEFGDWNVGILPNIYVCQKLRTRSILSSQPMKPQERDGLMASLISLLLQPIAIFSSPLRTTRLEGPVM
jgi:hypothetical protein